jgi:solute:Na+ symporter, SSS family
VGLVGGLLMLYNTPNPVTGKQHFGGAQYVLSHFGFDTKVTVYTGILALLANLVVAVVGTVVLRALRAPAGDDATVAGDYLVDSGDAGVRPVPASPGERVAVT